MGNISHDACQVWVKLLTPCAATTQTRLSTTSSTFEVTPRADSLHSSSFEATEQSIAAALNASDYARKSSDYGNGNGNSKGG